MTMEDDRDTMATSAVPVHSGCSTECHRPGGVRVCVNNGSGSSSSVWRWASRSVPRSLPRGPHPTATPPHPSTAIALGFGLNTKEVQGANAQPTAAARMEARVLAMIPLVCGWSLRCTAKKQQKIKSESCTSSTLNSHSDAWALFLCLCCPLLQQWS